MVVECISSIYPILSILPVGYSKIACPGRTARSQGTTTIKTMKVITAGQTLLPMDVDLDVDVEEEDRGMVADSKICNMEDKATPMIVRNILEAMTAIVTEVVLVTMIYLLLMTRDSKTGNVKDKTNLIILRDLLATTMPPGV